MRKLQTVLFAITACTVQHGALLAQVGVPEVPKEAKVTIRVIGEDGAPIEGADVGVGFLVGMKPGTGFGTKELVHNGVTGKNGTFEATDRCGGGVGAGVSKQGFYRSTSGLYTFKDLKDGKWQPWNPTIDLVLKPILNPIPLYAKRLEKLTLPVIGSPVGFDFAAGDWVAPHGKGTTPDLFFQLDRNSIDVTQPFEANLRISFPNPDDGIQPVVAAPHVGSELRLPREAPEQGYQAGLAKRIYRKAADQPIEKDNRDDQNWLLRVRTVKKKEKIEQANYAKIDGDIRFYPNGVLQLTYYFNPAANDRNLEFDPKRNLFGELPLDQKVTAP